MNGLKKEYIYSAIGILIMLSGFFLQPFDPLTVVGLRLLTIFAGVLFLWSSVGGIWPSLLAIALFGLSGYYGEANAGFTETLAALFGDETFIVLIMMFTFFGAIKSSGCMAYVAQWILTRKIIVGRPYLILTLIGLTAYLMAVTTNAFAALMMMWSMLASICQIAEIEHGKDKLWTALFGIIFLCAGLGHCALPFKTTGFAMNRAYTSIIGDTYPIAGGSYILFNFIMTLLLLVTFLLLVKFVYRTDVSKLKNLTPEEIIRLGNLPPISKVQKTFLIILPIFIACLMIPSITILKGTLVYNVFKTLGISGTAIFFVLALGIARIDGKPVLNFAVAAKEGIMWNIVFLVIAAKNIGTALANADVGVTAFLKQLLMPILGGKPEFLVVFILCVAAIIVTNLANNVSMAITFMPLVLVFSKQSGLNPAPIMQCIMILVFVAMMTPGASTQAALCYGSPYYSPKEIRSYALPLSIIAVFLFTFIGYPLAKLLLAV